MDSVHNKFSTMALALLTEIAERLMLADTSISSDSFLNVVILVVTFHVIPVRLLYFPFAAHYLLFVASVAIYGVWQSIQAGLVFINLFLFGDTTANL